MSFSAVSKACSTVALIASLALAAAQTRLQSDLQAAGALLAKGSVTDAIVLLRNTVKLNPQSADAHLMLGSALALAPRRDEALVELKRAVELQPNSASAHNTLGMALAKFAEFEAARKAFEKAIALDSWLLDARVNLALILAQSDEPIPASEQVARAVELCGKCPRASYLRFLAGRLYDKRNMVEAAIKGFEAAIRLRPDYAEAYLELSSVKAKAGDADGALRALETAVKLAPENAEARYRLGVEYMGRNKAAAALDHLREAYRLKPDDRGVVYNFARALRANGQAVESDAVIGKLAGQVKSSGSASEQLLQTRQLNDEGVALEKSGQIAAAVEKYKAALNIDPLLAPIRRNLGLALCRLSRWDEGIAELRETLRLYPDDAETTRALYIALDQAAAAGH